MHCAALQQFVSTQHIVHQALVRVQFSKCYAVSTAKHEHQMKAVALSAVFGQQLWCLHQGNATSAEQHRPDSPGGGAQASGVHQPEPQQAVWQHGPRLESFHPQGTCQPACMCCMLLWDVSLWGVMVNGGLLSAESPVLNDVPAAKK